MNRTRNCLISHSQSYSASHHLRGLVWNAKGSRSALRASSLQQSLHIMSASRFIVNRRPDFEGEPDASQANQCEQQLGTVLQGSILPFVQEGIGSSRKATCYTGTAGIAYALWHLHTTLQANPSIAIPGSTAVGLSTSVVPTMLQLADLALAEVAKGMHPARMVSLLDGAAGVYMTGRWCMAQLPNCPPSPTVHPYPPHAAPPAGPEVPAPSLLQQQLQQQGPIPGLLQPEQHWEMCRQCVQAFASCVQYAMQSDSDEVLYGRGGYLMGAVILHTHLCKVADEGTRLLAQPLMEVARQVALAMLDSGRSGATMVRGNPQPPLFYVWPGGAGGKPYLGAAHGLMGILYAMLHCLPLLQDPGAVMDIKAALRYVLAHEQDLPGARQGSGGHYPTQMGDFKPSERALVHWCHGAPGAALLFCKAHEVFGGGGGGAAYLPAACRAGEVVWSRGLLRKGPGLCHGVAGNGFVLERLWKAGAGTKWLHRAQQFGLALGDREVQETFVNPDNPYSLFQGASAGVAYLADLLTITNAQHHHLAQCGTDAGPLKPQSAPLTLGFPCTMPELDTALACSGLSAPDRAAWASKPHSALFTLGFPLYCMAEQNGNKEDCWKG